MDFRSVFVKLILNFLIKDLRMTFMEIDRDSMNFDGSHQF